MSEILFYAVVGLAVASFLLFAYQVVLLTRQTVAKPPTPPREGISGAEAQSFSLKELIAEMGTLSASFAKAGPLATTATLCVFFVLIALVASGIVTVGVKPAG